MSTVTNNEELVFFLEGRIDSGNAAAVENEIQSAMTAHPDRTPFFDCSRLDYISSAGLRVVLLAHKMMASSNGKMNVRNPSEFCNQVFAATGMDGVLSITQG